MSKGCHSIIRQGAKLVETTAHILEDLGPLALQVGQEVLAQHSSSEGTTAKPVSTDALSNDQKLCLQQLDHAPTSIDQIVVRTGLPVHRVSGCLLEMELHGLLRCEDGNYSLS